MIKFLFFISMIIEINAADIVSSPADIRDYYYNINGCWVDKDEYNANPTKFYYQTFCEE